jgi:hypothetical protein
VNVGERERSQLVSALRRPWPRGAELEREPGDDELAQIGRRPFFHLRMYVIAGAIGGAAAMDGLGLASIRHVEDWLLVCGAGAVGGAAFASIFAVGRVIRGRALLHPHGAAAHMLALYERIEGGSERR